jgi:hypothetical protein
VYIRFKYFIHMALISLGPLVTNIKGKFNGSVFSANSAGNTVRTKYVPRRKTSFRRSRQNNIWKYLTQSWLALTPTQQADWNSYAANFTFQNKLGAPVAARGNIVFATTNFYYWTFMGGALMLNPPGFFTPPPVSLQSWLIDGHHDQFETYWTPPPEDCYMTFYASKPYRPGSPVFNERRILFFTGAFCDTHFDFIDLFADYTNRVAPLKSGYNIQFATRRVHISSFAWSPFTYTEMEII